MIQGETQIYKDCNTTITKTREAPQVGQYQETKIDQQKREADFRILQVNPYFIRWRSGEGEIVNKRRLNKLQKKYTWTTDF